MRLPDLEVSGPWRPVKDAFDVSLGTSGANSSIPRTHSVTSRVGKIEAVHRGGGDGTDKCVSEQVAGRLDVGQGITAVARGRFVTL
ncbi:MULTISPECIES: hypothetical protein [unclassified Streptomyces]|uniref:hypothetical protein n=1 Tax=unclassified Streptomyces TaxID=2593676 RepID=UPI002E16C6F2|nr:MULTISPECIES: hypothetical protein [unclassified Streptomyces]